MFKRTYLRRNVATGDIVQLPFTLDDARCVGLTHAPARGLPQLEAYERINTLNISQDIQRYVYALPVD